jgi:hypothetical protein
MRDANRKLLAINKILRDLAPDLRPINASRVSEHLPAWPHVERALGILGGWRAMNSLQEKAGEPVLPMSALDPGVSEAASPLWMAGKYRPAVNDAATSLNIYAQARIGRQDIPDKDLMAQAFSEKDPEEGKSRLRCPGNPESETVRSQMEGARAFSIGTFQAIRNPAHHLAGDWNPALRAGGWPACDDQGSRYPHGPAGPDIYAQLLVQRMSGSAAIRVRVRAVSDDEDVHLHLVSLQRSAIMRVRGDRGTVRGPRSGSRTC